MFCRTYLLQEPNWKSVDFPIEYTVAGNAGPVLVAYRALVGALDLTTVDEKSTLKLRYDHIRRKRATHPVTPLRMAEDLFGDGATVEAGRANLSKLRKRNADFFKSSAIEILHACAEYSKGKNLSAFLFVYRVIEKVAVAFPVIYVSSRRDFHAVHANLKAYYEGNEKGELGVLRKFAKELAANSDVLGELKIDFLSGGMTEKQFRAAFDAVKKSTRTELSEDADGGGFEVSYSEAVGVLIDVRNRLFHNSNSGQKNIDVDRLGDLEAFCGMLAGAGLHWIALTMTELVTYSLIGDSP